MANGESRLPDKGTALKHLPIDAQKDLAAGLGGESRHWFAGAGIDRLKFTQRSGLAAGGAGQCQFIGSGAAVQPAGHGDSGPRGEAVFVSDEAGLVPLTAFDAKEHSGQEGAPGGLSGFIGSLYNI